MADILLSTPAHSFQKTGLEGSVPWFQLPLLFGVSDQAKGLVISLSLDFFLVPTPFSMIKIHILDGTVMQQLISVIPGCV